MVIHFNSPEERMKYLKGNYEEIVLPVVEEKEDGKVEEKPKKAKKSAKKSKKEDENGKDKAE
ncbi:MAG: hypothetical protein U0L88_00350 [Acutalibacteraceae bacterium]|nr:hypothetical protein [Acutalibacteraceae bacterium]